MTSTRNVTEWPAVKRYLEELNAALEGVPGGERQMILADVVEHISAALSEMPDPQTADVDQVLATLGSPQAIVAEGIGTSVAPVSPKRGFASSPGYAILTILLLAFGGFWGFGWIVGVVLLWASRAWRWPAKVVGTLVLPGGLVFIVLLEFFSGTTFTTMTATECTSRAGGGKPVCTSQVSGAPEWLGLTVTIGLLLLQILSAVYLYRKFRSATAAK